MKRIYRCTRAVLALTFTASLAVVTGCSSTSGPEPDSESEVKELSGERAEREHVAKEILPSTQTKIDSPQDVLFQTAKRSYHNGLYSVAIDQFEALRNNFPTGPYADFAELKAADCHYEGRAFDIAAQRYEDFSKNRPGSPASAYALMRAAKSYQISSKGLGRDAAQLEKARELYDRLLEIYPDSVYVGEAVTARAEIVEELMEYEAMIADFYRRRGNEEAYAARTQVLQNKWNPLIEESRKQIVRAGADPGAVEVRSAETGAVSEPAVLKASRVDLLPPPAKVEDDSAAAVVTALENAAPGDFVIERVACSDRNVFLFLNRPFDDAAFLESHSRVQSGGESLRVELPRTSAPAIGRVDCLGDRDLSLSQNGVVTIDGAESAALLALSNPPRLLLAID